MKRSDLLDLNEAVQNPGRTLRFDISTTLTQEEDLDLVSPIVGTLEAVSTGNVLLVSGEFVCRVVVECARCSEPVEVDLEFEMNDEFMVEGVPSSYASDGFAKVMTEDEPDPIFNVNALIPDSYLRQGLILNLPMQALCSGDWDKPCPGQEDSGIDPTAKAHPAFGALDQFRTNEASGE